MALNTKRLTPSFRLALSNFANPHRFAKAMGRPWATVQYWLELGYIPESWAMKVEQVTGGEVTAITVIHEANQAKAVKRAQEAA